MSPRDKASTELPDYFGIVCGDYAERFGAGNYHRSYYEGLYGRVLPAASGTRCLDLGCGGGHFLDYLASRGFTELTGVDRSAQAIARARELVPNAVFHHGAAADFVARHEGTGFDLVALNDVIEHLPPSEAIALVTDVVRRCNRGALLLIKTPNMHNPVAQTRRYCDLTHHFGYTVPSLTQLFATAGVEPLRIEPEPMPPALERTLRGVVGRLAGQVVRRIGGLGVWALGHSVGIENPRVLSDNLIAVGRVRGS